MKNVTFTELEKLEYGRYEAMNALMTNVQYSGEEIKSIVITSCGPDEGKSTVSFDLARAFAGNGNRTLFMDMDFRKSVLISRYRVNFNGNRIAGLVQLLARKVDPSDAIFDTNIENLHVAFAGATAANPPGLLHSNMFEYMIKKLREKYDMIIIDAPPVGAVIDAAIIAPKVDGVVLLCAYDQTSGKQALAAKKQLEATGCNLLGVVMNKIPMKKNGGYYKYYGEYAK